MTVTVVALLSDQCYWCERLLSIWDKVKEELIKVNPTVNIIKIIVKNKIIPSPYPKQLLTYYEYWQPMILLIRDEDWTKLKNVEVMNGTMINGQMEWTSKYDTTKPEMFGKWLKGVNDAPIIPFINKCQNLLNLSTRF